MPNSLSIIRHTYTLITPKIPYHSLKKTLFFSTNSSISAEKFLTHLQKDQTHVEKTLNSVKAKLDSECITEVLQRCAIDKPQLGFRFFIWAALNPTHRHTSYMYNKACKLLNIEQNPQIVVNVIDEYKAEGLIVSVKMFKVVLNLCRAAKDASLGLWVLKKMKECNCRPDTVSYNVVIRLVVEKGQLDEALRLMNEMGLIDLYPDNVTYISIIKGLCDVGRLEDAFGLVKVMKGRGCIPNAVIYSTLLDGICMHGSLEMAMEFLNGMEKQNEEIKPNVVSYTTMIKGFVEKRRAKEALRVLNQMVEYGTKPNRVTFGVILDGLCKEGLIDEARKLVDKFSGNGVQCDELYSLLVVSLLRSDEYKEAENMFRTMLARGMRPNGLASSSVIKRVIFEGRVLEGFLLFDALEKSRNLLAFDSDFCSNLLDVLCKENCFVEASKVVNVMIEGKIPLKYAYADNIIKHLEASGEYGLSSSVSSIKSKFSGINNVIL